MAQKVVVHLVDDLTGEPIESGAGETVRFGLDGVEHEVDLSREHADQMREAINKYVKVGRKVGGRKVRGTGNTAKRDASETKAIREWAIAEGYDVSARGRIPMEIQEAYRQAKQD